MQDEANTKILRNKLFKVLFISIFILLAFLISISIYIQQKQVNMEKEKYHILIHHSLNEIISHNINTYKYIAKRVISEKRIKNYIYKKDGDSLHLYLEKKWRLLKKENPYLKKVCFYSPDEAVFLKMQNTTALKTKDSTIKSAIKYVHKNKKVIVSYEQDKNNAFFEIITPVFDNKKYLGAIEIMINSNFLLKKLEDITGGFAALFIKNTENNSEFSVNGFVFKGDKNSKIFNILKFIDKKNLFNDNTTFKYKDKKYALHIEDLTDFKGNKKIKILFFKDVTFSENARWISLYILIAFSFLLFFVLLFLIGKQVNIFEKKLKKIHVINVNKYKHLSIFLKTVLKVNRTIFTNSNKDLLLENICINLKENENFSDVWITLYDEKSNKTDVITTHTKNKSAIYKETFLNSDRPYCLKKFTNNQILFIENILEFNKDHKLNNNLTKSSVLILKLQYKENIYGVIELFLSKNYKYTGKDNRSLIGIADDISSALFNIETQENLQDEKLKLKSIFRTAPIGLGAISNRIFKNVNEQFCKMVGYTKEELIEKDARILYLSDKAYNFVSEKYRQIKGKEISTVETQLKCKDGKIIDILFSFTLLNSSDFSLGVTFSALDITDRKKMESELREHKKNLEKTVSLRTKELNNSLENLKMTQEHLIQTEKMAALGGLVAGVAHEINTPIGLGITGMSHFLSETTKIKELYKNSQMTQDEFEEYLSDSFELANIINKNLIRAANLVKSFKRISIDQTNEEKREFVLKPYIKETLLSLHNKIKETKIKVKITSLENDFSIYSYPGAFSQIVTNLIMNSLTHAYNQDDEGTIILDFKVKNSTLNFLYKDDGKGIKEENIKKIFDPFFTTNREHGGSGLGLNVVYNIVTQQLKGVIECKSEVGKYTEFYIRIPL